LLLQRAWDGGLEVKAFYGNRHIGLKLTLIWTQFQLVHTKNKKRTKWPFIYYDFSQRLLSKPYQCHL
jgi:hypothetical protein